MNLARSNQRTERPTLLVLADSANADAIQDLFARRGFAVVVTPSMLALERYMLQAAVPQAAIIDFGHPEAHAALEVFTTRTPSRPALVGIAAHRDMLSEDDSVDAMFARPVDKARMYVRVVELIAERRTGKRAKRLTGVVGVVDGNDLFRLVAKELHAVVPPANAGAILEKALRDLGSGPFVLKEADLAAMLASGRLAGALAPFGETSAIDTAMYQVAMLLMTRLP